MQTPEIQGAPVAHLPVIRGLIDQLGIHEIINELLPMHPLARVSDADCVVTMMLNVLCGRVALFRMDWWLARTDAELLLGPGKPADAFDDNRLSAALDHIDDIGTDKLLTAVVKRYLERPGRDTTYSVHQDFTSYSFYGEYEDVSPSGPAPAFGHSKDLRPDLKQLVFGLSIHGNSGIPLVCSTLDGNTSDARANRDHLARLSKLLPEEDDITIVADSKLVDEQTIGQLLSAGFHFVSLVPNTYNIRGASIADAWKTEPEVAKWPILGSHPGRKKSDPPVFYRGWSVERPFPVLLHKTPSGENPGPCEAVASVETMRFLVVHSDSLEENFNSQLEHRLAEEKEDVAKAVERFNRKPASCRNDAMEAGQKAMPKLRFHKLDLQVEAEVHPLKRKGRGRPPKDEAPPTETVWVLRAVLTDDKEAVIRERQHASCFSLITDHLAESGWDDVRILAEYRHQGIVEGNTGFRWLKGPAAVSPMFLKTPTRMRALGLVMIFALMVRNYWQYKMRTAAKDAGEKILHLFTKRPVANLTAEMAMEHFGGMHMLQLRQEDGSWKRLSRDIPETGRQILRYLGLSEDIFWTPPSPKIGILRI